MATWITSDLHLNHHNILSLEAYNLRKNGLEYIDTIDKYNELEEEEYKEKIRSVCVENFSKFYYPKEIIFMKELPQTPLMKVDFMKLSQMKPGDKVYAK